MIPRPESAAGQRQPSSRTRTVLAVSAAAISLLLLYWLQTVLLLAFLGLLLGIILDWVAELQMRHLHFRRGLSVILASILFVGGVSAALLLILSPLLKEGTALVNSLPDRMESFKQKSDELTRQYPWLKNVFGSSQPAQPAAATPAQLAKKALFTASSVLEAIGTAMATFFLGLFLAWDPQRWISGAAALWLGDTIQNRLALLQRMGNALRSYILTVAVQMLVMGVLWSLGLWVIHIEYFLLFGAIGGLVEVVPYVGPLLGLIPPLLVSIAKGGKAVALVLILYAVLHVIEGYIVVPYLMQKREHLPPPIIVLSILAFGSVFGILGTILAIPLATVIYVWVVFWMERNPQRMKS